MKKLTSFLIIFALILTIAGCSSNKSNDKQSTTAKAESSVTDSISESVNEKNETTKAPEQTTQTDRNDGSIGGSEITPRKYRDVYYSIDWYFALFVGEDNANAWRKNNKDIFRSDAEEMPIIKFIKDFNISKEDFEKVVEQDAQWVIENGGVPTRSPKDFLNQMQYEIFNADIIYTFDNEIINEYYLTPDFPFRYPEDYEYAVITGLYETKTTDFYYPDDHYCTKRMNEENADFEAIKADAAEYIPSDDPTAFILEELEYYEKGKNS